MYDMGGGMGGFQVALGKEGTKWKMVRVVVVLNLVDWRDNIDFLLL